MLMSSRLKFDLNTLANEMLDSFDPALFESKTTTFLDPAMAGGQFLKAIEDRLRSYGHSDKNIAKRVTGYAENHLYMGWSRKYRGIIGHTEVKDLNEIEDMNFDVTIGNPPFSENKGGTSSNTKQVPIYPEFFRLCSEKSKVVAMIMPVTDTSTSKQLRDHNELMNRHLQSRQRCDEHFEILVDTHWVLWDKSKDAKEFIKMDYDLPLPSRERLPRFTRGNNKYSVTKSGWAGTYQEPKTSAAITVLSRIRKDGPSYDYLEPAETNQKIKLLTGKWLLATVGTSNNGDTLGNAHIIKNDSNGLLAGANVYVWEFDKKKDAVKLQEWIHSEEFKSVCRKSGFIGSLAKTRDLPNYQ